MTKTKDNITQTPFHLLIPAAGSGSRMGGETPKQYLKINGKTILRHTIDKFININGLQSITIIINSQDQALYDDAVQGLELKSPIHGADTRKQSVYNGLKQFDNNGADEVILIHDVARPLVQQDDIEKLLQIMKNADAATLASPISDTLLKNNDTIPRDDIWTVQTPQGFNLQKLIAAHEQFKDDDSFTDDAGLMRAMDIDVKIIPASRTNIKITTSEDFDMAQTVLNNTFETRTTMGFDVHAFEKETTNRKLMLGGIEIKHDFALTGHSDADVVLHAITDAIMAAINEGDIGTHFPPSDPQWKDADSAIFLEKANELLMKRQGVIKFIDVTIMAEAPKIGPHRTAMQERIANILNMDSNRISIKATTTEQLGFTGRKEGMACQAVATITLPNT